MADTSFHGTTVALNGRGCFIFGPAGSGKSTLALVLMAHGAELVADDQTILTQRAGQLIATAPVAIRGSIEAHGIGILSAHSLPEAPLVLAVDMGQCETLRLPPERRWACQNIDLPLVLAGGSAQVWAGILQYLKGGRQA
jgi:HPr kinase/phosphorylase